MSAGLHTRAREAKDRRPLLTGLLVLVLLIAAIIAWRAVRSTGDAACGETSSARLAAAPDIAPALEELAEGLVDEGRCVRLEVEAVPSGEMLNQLATGAGEAPDLWVPDSDVWARQLAGEGVEAETIAPAVATSPVVLAGGPAADTPATWLEAVSSGQVAMQDPMSTTPAALALVAPRAERKKSGASSAQIQSGLVTAAQHYAGGDSTKDVLASITASSKQLVPVTEQQYLAARRSNRSLTATVPETGTLVQKYPLLALPDRTEESNAVLGELFDYLQRPQGDALLAGHDFRASDGDPLPGKVGVGAVPTLAAPESSAVAEDLRAWQVLAVPSSMLVVLDASGSMDFETGSGTRMQLAADASRRALGAFPGTARIGLWLFSVDQGGPDVDHRVMAPLRRLDAKAGDVTQRQRLGGAIDEALALTDGGTGLYDTTLAAYREALESYDEDYFNSVVLMTDGANDDPGSIGLAELLRTLRAEADPSKPVRVIAIGISQEADMSALRKIAAATGGQAFPARDPRTILDVMAKALLAR